MSRTAAVQWNGTIICFCLFFLRTTDAACSSACLNTALDSTAPICNVTTGECLYGCKTGYAGFQCQIPCGENCVNCSASSFGDDSVCHQCALHYFKNGNDCEPCSDNCRQNVSSNASLCNEIDGYCEFGCEDGYYGPQCDRQCNSNCLENFTSGLPICDSQNGTCTFGCKDNLTYGPICDKSCSHLCVHSVCDRDGTCKDCSFQFYGPRCTKVCSGGCNGKQEPPCHRNGTCKDGCIRNFWGPYCVACNKNCVGNRSQEIVKCDETDGRCTLGCEKGYYGFYCENRCSTGCQEDSTSDLPTCDQEDGTCTFGCTDEHVHGPKCNYYCSHMCMNHVCDRDGTCRNCRFDLTGPQCKGSCSNGCVDNQDYEVPRCHQNETCKEGCETNFWGPTCIECNENCAGDTSKQEHLCRESDGFCVQGCKAGKYGMHCSDDCPYNCKDNLCYQINGKCINKCSKGFYGEYCNNSCSPNCLNQGDICLSENGTCIGEICAISWFGLRCQNRCSVNCVNNNCDRNSGICSDGCTAGHFGNTCEANCLNGTYGPNCAANCSQGCVSAVCNPDNGKCECTKSYIGAKCDTKVKVYTEATPNNALAINLSSIAGVVLLGTVIMIIVTVYKCRKDIQCFKPKETELCEHTYENSAMQVATYNGMLHAKTTQITTDDCIVTENVYDEIQEEDARGEKTITTSSIESRVSKNSDRSTVFGLYEDLQRNNMTNDHYYTEVSELSAIRL